MSDGQEQAVRGELPDFLYSLLRLGSGMTMVVLVRVRTAEDQCISCQVRRVAPGSLSTLCQVSLAGGAFSRGRASLEWQVSASGLCRRKRLVSGGTLSLKKSPASAGLFLGG